MSTERFMQAEMHERSSDTPSRSPGVLVDTGSRVPTGSAGTTVHAAERLLSRIMDRTAVVGVIGLGYVGLPLAEAVTSEGFPVVGFDIDPTKIDRLACGDAYLRHFGKEKVESLLKGGFSATTDFSRLAEADVITVCVPTPLTKNRDPDLSYVRNTATAIAACLRAGQLVILESTTYPGTTAEVVKPILESSGLCCGREFFLAYSPEREDPGNDRYSTTAIPKVVGADDQVSRLLAEALYRALCNSVVAVSSAATAEAAKLTENIFRAVNIALVNELKLVFGEMGVDIWEVIDAAKTKPFGYMPFYPGPGLGGHCIPIDPFYLTWKAREHGIATRFIELAGEINTLMPHRVVERIADGLSRRLRKSLNGSKLLIVGIAYKKNLDDVRESPGLRIMNLLESCGSEVDFFDPHIDSIPPTREYPELSGRRSLKFSVRALQSFDCAVVITDHDDVDYAVLERAVPVVVDTRNVFSRLGLPTKKVLKA